MPIYEYKCPKCKRVYELLIYLKEKDNPQFCTECGNLLEKIISQSNFKLKKGGSGWSDNGYGLHK
ncbi:MAG: zinc ribbon domain-containing protein [Nanoarchaeota archaeon]|nr:zinc ribbon domain-containing protein [Nanoarchaeota archaeon]